MSAYLCVFDSVGGSASGGGVKRFWNDDIQPCIERHCVSLLRPDAATSYRACLRKYCSSQMLSYAKKSSLMLGGSGATINERGRPGSDDKYWMTLASPGERNIVLSVYRPAGVSVGQRNNRRNVR